MTKAQHPCHLGPVRPGIVPAPPCAVCGTQWGSVSGARARRPARRFKLCARCWRRWQMWVKWKECHPYSTVRQPPFELPPRTKMTEIDPSIPEIDSRCAAIRAERQRRGRPKAPVGSRLIQFASLARIAM